MKPTFRSAAQAPAPSPAASTVTATERNTLFFIRSLLDKLNRKTADARAAADVQRLAGDEAIGRVGKKHHGAGHVVRPADAAHGDVGGQFLRALAAAGHHVVEHGGLD